jgi:hypothetical protein
LLPQWAARWLIAFKLTVSSFSRVETEGQAWEAITGIAALEPPPSLSVDNTVTVLAIRPTVTAADGLIDGQTQIRHGRADTRLLTLRPRQRGVESGGSDPAIDD